MMNNKKGISAIVATVLIILITVAAVTIIWAAIIPMVTQLDSVTACSTAVQQVQVEDKGYTCFNDVSNRIEVQVSRGAKDFNLTGLQILVVTAGTTDSYLLGDAAVTPSTVPGGNEEVVYIITGITGIPNEVKIAPVIALGKTDEVCDASSGVALRAC